MRQLSIQSRKLNIIEQLILLEDDMVLKQVEDLINISLHEPTLKRITTQELIQRAQLAEKDIENGDVYSVEEVKRISQNW
jgi:predicted RecB family endonuclease